MFQLVIGDHALSLNLNFDSAVEDQLTLLVSMDVEAGAGSQHSTLAELIVEAITAVVDPAAAEGSATEKQIRYALLICRELDLRLPRDALRDRLVMAAFLDRYADTFRHSRQRKRRDQSAA